MALIRTNDNVKFTAGNGKEYTGKVTNAAYYPGGQRAGKHFRINVGGGVIATIFANGPVGKSVTKVEA